MLRSGWLRLPIAVGERSTPFFFAYLPTSLFVYLPTYMKHTYILVHTSYMHPDTRQADRHPSAGFTLGLGF